MLIRVIILLQAENKRIHGKRRNDLVPILGMNDCVIVLVCLGMLPLVAVPSQFRSNQASPKEKTQK